MLHFVCNVFSRTSCLFGCFLLQLKSILDKSFFSHFCKNLKLKSWMAAKVKTRHRSLQFVFFWKISSVYSFLQFHPFIHKNLTKFSSHVCSKVLLLECLLCFFSLCLASIGQIFTSFIVPLMCFDRSFFMVRFLFRRALFYLPLNKLFCSTPNTRWASKTGIIFHLVLSFLSNFSLLFRCTFNSNCPKCTKIFLNIKLTL